MSCTQKQQLVCFPKVRVYKPWFRHFNDHKDFRNEGTVHLFSLMALFSYANFRSNERVINGDRYMEAPGQWICKLGSSSIRSELGSALSSCARMLPIASSCASAASVMSMLSWQRSVNCPTRCSCAGILTTLHSARILKRKFKPFETMEVFLPMKQMIPLKKQSKKAQKEQHAKQRGSWYGISPVTRTVPNGKAYDRNRVKRGDREFAD